MDEFKEWEMFKLSNFVWETISKSTRSISNEVDELNEDNKNFILYGPPETGKTYNGAALMEAGIPMPVEMGEFKAYQMHLVGEE